MRVAVTHDWVISIGQREKMLERFSEIFPSAALFTLRADRSLLTPNQMRHRLFDAGIGGYRRMWDYIEKFPKETAKFDFNHYELVITNSMGPFRWVKKEKREDAGGCFQVAYFYEAYPYLWEDDEKARQLGTFWSKFDEEDRAAFRELDLEYARGIDLAVTHSEYMRDLIYKRYGVDSVVIPPSVEDHLFYPEDHTYGDYYAAVADSDIECGIELLLNTFNFIKEKLVIIGRGRRHEEYRSQARNNITFINSADARERAHVMSKAKALIVTDNRRLVLSALEALRMGVPVIALPGSMAAEYVTAPRYGIVCEEDTVNGLMPAIFKFEESSYSRAEIAAYAAEFTRAAFRENFMRVLKENLPADLLEKLVKR